MNRLLLTLVGLTLALCVQSTVQAQTGQPATGPQTGDARVGEYTLEQAEMLVNEKVAEKMRAISERRRENIIKLESLLQNVDYRKDQDRAPKVLHMLAENHWEEGLFQYLQRRTEWDKALDQFNAGTLSTRPDEPVEDYSQSLEYYRKILREFPNYPRIDEVIFYLGKGAMKEGKAKQSRALQKEGVDFLNRLVKNYPKSRFLAEAHLAMAEYYFETNSLAFARFNYDVIIEKYQKSAMYNYALYKLGWVHFNLADFDKAVETFQSVVAMVGKEQSQGVIEFKNQALNDLVVTYAEVPNGWMQARDYFMKVLDEKEAYRKMRALGDLLVAQDKDPEAIAVFRHFIEREKTTRNIPEYFGILLSIYKKTNDMPNLDAVTAEIIEYFKPNGTWITVNKNDEEVVDAANLMTEEYLLFLANFYHVEAQRLKSADMYRRAADRYATYLTRFGDSKNAYKVNFYYAEILYEQMKDFAKAKEQYQRVIERETKGEFVEDSALGVIYSTQELMVAEGIEGISKKAGMEVVKVDPKAAEAPIPETALHPLEVDYIAGADKYVELLTELIKDPEVRKKNPERGEKIPEIMYIAASLYYRHGKFQEAVNRLRILFEYDKSSKYAAYAVFTLLDCYQRLAQWPMVEEWARKLIAARNFTVRKEADLKKIVAIAMTENARLLSVEKKYDSAIAEAMRVYEEFRRNEDMASKALFNVAALYEGQKEVDKAVRTYLRVVKEFPKAEVAPEALFTIGLIYESQTEFDKAADYFESMEQFKALKEPTEADKKENWKKLQEQISDALQNAGLIREALGQPKEAIDVYQKFVKYFPGDAEVPKVYLRIGTVYENQGDAANLKRAHDHYQLWLKKNYPIPEMTIEALARSGDCLKRIDKVKNRRAATLFFQRAQEVFSRSIANPDVVNKAKVFAAQAAFEVADYAYDDFTVLNIPSTLNPSVLKRSLEAKAEAQIKAEKMFDAVLDYKSGGWSAGSLFKIGLMYFEFKEKLLEVPVPDGLDPDTENMYLAILEEIARPVEEKSLRAFERALKLAHEEKVYNVWSKACAQYAAKVNQDTFPVAGDDQVKANHIKDTLASTSFIRSLRRGDVEVKMVQEARR